MSDEQIPKDGHLLSPANKQTSVEKGPINKAVNQLQQNKTLKQTTLRENVSSAPQTPGTELSVSLQHIGRWRPVFAYLRWLY